MSPQGQLIVFTGDGRGKTTAAMGIALRSAGHKMYVSVIQFIKRPLSSGEAKAVERLAPYVEIISAGKGFVGLPNDTVPLQEHREAARSALDTARKHIASGSWDVVILDEITSAVALGLLKNTEVLELVKQKPSRLHLVLTGREAHASLRELADSVTETHQVKHSFTQGVPAQRGIDF